jgi:hypothetical protein
VKPICREGCEAWQASWERASKFLKRFDALQAIVAYHNSVVRSFQQYLVTPPRRAMAALLRAADPRAAGRCSSTHNRTRSRAGRIGWDGLAQVAVAGATQTKWTLSNNSTEGKKAMDSFSECGICRCPVENNLECPACLQATPSGRTHALTPCNRRGLRAANPVRASPCCGGRSLTAPRACLGRQRMRLALAGRCR